MTELFWYDETSSTQDSLKSLVASESLPDFTTVAAGLQTKGRGSRGREWKSPFGNLYASVLLPVPDTIPHYMTLAALLAGLILRDVAITVLSDCVSLEATQSLQLKQNLFLKWPNDLYGHIATSPLKTGAEIAGKIAGKVGGVLLEVIEDTANTKRLVLGIGLNILHAPTDLDKQAGAINDLLKDTPYTLADDTAKTIAFKIPELAKVWFERLKVYPESIVQAWQQYAHPIGYPLSIKVGQSIYKGTYQSLRPDGGMVFQRKGGNEPQKTVLYAGEVLA